MRIEAEDLNTQGFKLKPNKDFASGGTEIKVQSSDGGHAWGQFDGLSGEYDVLLAYNDEANGQGRIKVQVGGTVLDDFRLTEDLHSQTAEAENYLIRTVAESIQLETGASIDIWGWRDGKEGTHIDYIEFVPSEDIFI